MAASCPCLQMSHAMLERPRGPSNRKGRSTSAEVKPPEWTPQLKSSARNRLKRLERLALRNNSQSQGGDDMPERNRHRQDAEAQIEPCAEV